MNSNMFYKHYDTDDSYFSLHDCCASNIFLENGVLTFYFKDGFWVTPDHKHNDLNEIVRTDPSRVDFCIEQENCNEITIYVFRKSLFGKTLRNEWKLDELINFINSGTFSLEFLYQYKSHDEQLIECCLHFDKSPYYYECQLKIPASKVIYRWNNLCKDRKW